MFTVNLYRFSKRQNSTKLPAGIGTQYNGLLKENSGIENPSISFNFTQPENFNYAYIELWKRYYFIEEWTWEFGVWTAHMSHDVLATNKTAIGNSTQYVTRSDTLYDRYITDPLYPATANIVRRFDLIDSVFTSDYSAGQEVLSVINSDSDIGTMCLYTGEANITAYIRQRLFANLTWGEFDFTSSWMNESIAKLFFNPFQYVTSAMWFPITKKLYSTLDQIKVGWWGLPAVIGKLSSYWITIDGGNFSLTDHPQALERGEYLNLPPYTERFLYYPPFGIIPISQRLTSRLSSIHIYVTIDLVSGIGYLKLTTGSKDSSILDTSSAQVGVPISVSNMDTTYGQKSVSFGSAVYTGLSTISTLINGRTNDFGDGIAGMNSTARVSGTNGGLAAYAEKPCLVSTYANVAYEGRKMNGRPLMKSVKINTLSGYIKCMNASIEMVGTRSECEQVERYLNGGFYYE